MESLSDQQCPYCETILSARGYFCPSCRKQARCKACNELVERGAIGCVMCGAEITTSAIEEATSIVLEAQAKRNKIHFERRGKSITLDADITDISSAYFADTIGSIVTNGNVQFRGRQNKPLFLQKETPHNTIAISTLSNEKSDQANANVATFDDEGLEEVLKRIFTFDNDELKLVDPRLKHSGKLDQAIRLTLLVIYTHELIGKSQVERSVLSNILIKSKLDNGHSRTWIANSDELIIKDNFVELSVPGREVAKAILAEIANPTVEVGKVGYSKPKTGKSSKRKKEKDGQKSQGSTSSDSKKNSSKTSPLNMLKILAGEGFFASKRKVGDIIEHCSINKAQHYKNSDLSGPLGRSIKDGILKREKNKSDNQYEYYV